MADARPRALNHRSARLPVAGAELYYEVRGQGPLMALIGAPMDADAFAPLANQLATDHTVLTSDPRGIHRSSVLDPEADSTPELRAADLARLIEAVDAGAATVFGSSGGAVTALALVQQRPDLVSTAIAHEPPLEELLEDCVEQRALTEDCCTTYLSGDILGGWSKFLAQANITMPPQALEQVFGAHRDPQVLADERYWFAHELRPSTWWRPDLDALTASPTSPTRIVAGIGQDSAGQTCERTTQALAQALRIEPVIFPGDHTGFVEDPVAFADHLRSVLRGDQGVTQAAAR